MWTWQECEDYNSKNSKAKVVDDWGAAANRFVEIGPGGSVAYQLESHPDEGWTLSVRYRNAADDTASILQVSYDGTSVDIELPPPPPKKRWSWISHNLESGNSPEHITFTVKHTCHIDGFFIHDEPLELPDDVRKLDPMVGWTEAEKALPGYWREIQVPEDITPRFEPTTAFPSDIAREKAGELWPVIESLSRKPCPYMVKAFDTEGGTDYNADYSWHALDKEKRWELPWSGALGVVNPNSDISYVIGFGFDNDPVSYDLDFRPVVHLADLIVYEVDLDEDLRCEVMFRCHRSDTLVTSVHLQNSGGEERRITVGELLSKTPLDNPPHQRYTLPGQMFGSGVTTTAGGPAWTGIEPGGKTVATCFYEWIRGRSRGRRLLATLTSAKTGREYALEAKPVDEPVEPPLGAVMGLRHPVIVPPGETVVLAFALNMHRFTLHDTWNPEITPELYRDESEEEAEEAAYITCADAISTDIRKAIRMSIVPYRTFPKITLPEKSWEPDFYACLELPRASTFSPLGNIKTPFYNFCRVHAHEPFGWWSYGMHAHEDLCTLFNNVADPDLSAQFLRGHILHQKKDGQYPYGVSHTINPRLTTREATAPLIAWEAWNSYLWSGDREFLEEAFDSGVRSLEWWLLNRDRCGEGLCHWLDTCNESVRDDAGLPTSQATGGSQNQEALDLNCYLLMQEMTLAEMAGELGLDEENDRFLAMADRRWKQMNVWMWHDEDRCYYGINELSPGWAKVKDISTFFTLWAGLAPEGRFESIVSLLEDPETFGLPYGPPTLAKNEPGYGSQKHWYGSNWVEMSLFPILGLQSYGYHKKATDLAYQNTKMVFDELERYGHFREYFNSIEGNGTDLIDYIWTAMPAYFIVSVFFGIQPDSSGLEIIPSLPKDWKHMAIENLQIRDRSISVDVKIDPEARKATASVNGRKLEIGIMRREVFIPWDNLTDGAKIEIVQPPEMEDTPHTPFGTLEDWSDVPEHEYPGDI